MSRPALLALLLAAPLTFADEAEPKAAKLSKEQLEKAEAAVKKHLQDARATDGNLVRLADDSVEKTLPAFAVYSLTFRQFPVARELPRGYKSANLVVVAKDLKPRVISDRKDLDKLFTANVTASTD